MAKDFFDDEYDKQQQKEHEQQQARQQAYDNWYGAPAPQPKKSANKPLYITLMCIALVACIGLGWLLGFIFRSVSRDTVDDAGEILDDVIAYLRDNYYRDISDEEWTAAVEASGTALMQSAGDRFCQLMSPQTYYDFCYPTGTSGGASEIFGISFLVEEDIGLYVSSVTADSAAFGYVQEGDIVLRLTNMRTKSGSAPVVGGVTFNEIVFGDYTSSAITQVMAETYSANFHILRADDSEPSGYSIVSVDNLTRAPLAKYGGDYDFQFIEFYFDRDHTNVSTSVNKPSGVTTESVRHLDELPDQTGYVRITEFMDYAVNENERVSAYDEFVQVMTLFNQLGLKHLVLDLKGNPGGNVEYVTNIGAMLVTDALLTDAQKSQVVNGNGDLLISYLDMPKPSHLRQNYYLPSSYSDYFDAPDGKCDIVVWTDVNSASASELLTGCLRDYGTAVQMGTTTYGKGIAQTWQELPFTGKVVDIRGNTTEYPWAVYYTCASYYSPLGHNIHGVGYTPDKPYDGLTDYSDLWQAVNNYWR